MARSIRAMLRRWLPWLPVIALVVALVVLTVTMIAFHGSPGVDAFNACVRQQPFLVSTERRAGARVIVMVKDRAQGDLVGEFAQFRSRHAYASFTSTIGPPSGTGEGNSRSMILFTKVPSGRDTNAILTCGFPEFPEP